MLLLLQSGSFLTLMSQVATFPPSGLYFPALDEFPPFGLHFAFSAVFLLGPAWSQSPHRSGMQLRRRESLLPLLSCVSILMCLSVFFLGFQSSFACQHFPLLFNPPLLVSILPCVLVFSFACQYSILLVSILWILCCSITDNLGRCF